MNMSRVPSQQRPGKKSLTRGMVVLIIVVVIGVSGLGIGLGFYFFNAQPAGDNTPPPPPPANTIVIGNDKVENFYMARLFSQSFAMPETTEATLTLLEIKIRVGDVINYQPTSAVQIFIQDAQDAGGHDSLGFGHISQMTSARYYDTVIPIPYEEFSANPWYTLKIKDDQGNDGIPLAVSRSWVYSAKDSNRYTILLRAVGNNFMSLGVSSTSDRYLDGKFGIIDGAGGTAANNYQAPWYVYNSAGYWYFPSNPSDAQGVRGHVDTDITDLAFQLVFAQP